MVESKISRGWLALASATALALSLSACSGKSSQSQSADNGSATAAATSDSSKSADNAKAAVEPSTVVIPAGTALSVRVNQTLGSDVSQAGQTFKGELASPVLIDGKPVLPKRAEVLGTVTAAESSGHFKGRSQLGLRLTQISYNGQTYQIRSSEWSRLGPSRGKRTAKMVGAGAGVGALVGALIGHGKGAVIGAATGAGAGTATEALTKPVQVTVPAETLVRFHLANSVEVKPSTMQSN
jgi:hypothetical protein